MGSLKFILSLTQDSVKFSSVNSGEVGANSGESLHKRSLGRRNILLFILASVVSLYLALVSLLSTRCLSCILWHHAMPVCIREID